MTKLSHVNKKVWKGSIALALIGGISLTQNPVIAHAETSKEIKIKKEKVDKQLLKVNKELKKAKENIKKKQKEFDETKKKINSVNKQIKETEKRIESRKEIIKSRLVTLQASAGNSAYLEVIFHSENIGDMINRIKGVQTMMKADQDIMDQQEQDRKELSNQKKDLDDKKKKLDKQFQELQESYSKLEIKQSEQKTLSKDLGHKFKNAQAAEEAEAQRKAEEEKARKEEERRLKEIEELQKLQQKNFEKESLIFAESLKEEKTSKTSTKVIKEASRYMGMKYVWGGSNPKTSFDCSGLTQWSYKSEGINLPRTAAQQYVFTKRIASTDLQPGDLVFFSYGSGIAHVGIYVGNGKMLNAQNNGVKIDNLSGYWSKYIAGFGRVPGVQ